MEVCPRDVEYRGQIVRVHLDCLNKLAGIRCCPKLLDLCPLSPELARTKNSTGSSPEILENEIPDESRDGGNQEIGSGKNVPEGPDQAPLRPHARAFKFPHQEIGVEQRDDEPNLMGSA